MKENVVVAAELGIPGPCKLVDDPEHEPGILVAIIQDIHHQITREKYNSQLGRQETVWGDVTRTRFVMRLDKEEAVEQAQHAQVQAERRAREAASKAEQASVRSDALKESLAAITAAEATKSADLAVSEGRVRDEMDRNRRLETDLGKQRRNLNKLKKALGELQYNELLGSKRAEA
jgi:hypothetical protein